MDFDLDSLRRQLKAWVWNMILKSNFGCNILNLLQARPCTLRYPFVWREGVPNGYSSTRVSLWDSLMFGRLAMGFANVRAGTRVLMLVLVQAARVADAQRQ